MWHVNQNMCRLTCYLRTPFLALCLLTCLAIFDFASCQNITDLKSANYESRSRVESWVSSLTCSEVSFDKQAYQEEFAQIKPSPAVFVPLSRYLVSPCPRRPSEHPETNEYYQSLESPPTLAVGVLSAAKNTAHRMAMRKTWLSELGPRAVVKFFVAANDPGELDLSLPRSLLLECLTFNDILLVPGLKESYFSTPYKALSIFHWGEKIVGGYYTLRVNDDVYLDAKSLEEELAKVVPSRVYGLLLIPGDR